MFLELLAINMIVFLAPQFRTVCEAVHKARPWESCAAPSLLDHPCGCSDHDGRARCRAGGCGENTQAAPQARVPSRRPQTPGRAARCRLRSRCGLAGGRPAGGRGGAWEDARAEGGLGTPPLPSADQPLCARKPSKHKCVRTAESASAIVPGDSPAPLPAECRQWEADGGLRG